MTVKHEYILETDNDEIERLRFQHQVWLPATQSLWERAGVVEGMSVADLGCGPGFASLDLAALVGARGRLVACDQSPRFIEHLRHSSSKTAAADVITSRCCPLESLDLDGGSLDVAYARWLFCWLRNPAEQLYRVAGWLKPGGAIVLQEYIDWAAMRMIPRAAPFDAAVDACMRSWHDNGITIDFAECVPQVAQEAGLVIERFRPIARIGGVGSLEWRWLRGFFASYLPGLERGHELDSELSATWSSRAESRLGYVTTPTLVEIILRRM